MLFRYFDWLYARGLISPAGGLRDELIITAPIWVPAAILIAWHGFK